MIKKEVNINSFQKNLPELLDFVSSGDMLIITKSDIPIAKVTPIENPTSTIRANYFSAKAIEAKRVLTGEAPENWFG